MNAQNVKKDTKNAKKPDLTQPTQVTAKKYATASHITPTPAQNSKKSKKDTKNVKNN